MADPKQCTPSATVAARVLSEPRLVDRIVAFVAEHPGCTSGEIGARLGYSAATGVAVLARDGQRRLIRRKHGHLWHYYPRSAS